MPGKRSKEGIFADVAGDVYETCADVSELMNDFGFKPPTTIEEGLSKFADWFLDYYNYAK